ncbi:WecB/TagA/CpsF family glycosyltransferase [Cytobacillus sp. IB215316]|uniref:WecB/TagA/CpsF family glycosyltransferase n=1 Tax=Cytobacillus sp. IB215316 TaxID=3097354 RepID=UPI002A171C7E|nr:WecB/TagA/CpsF family glycosyltransferase [Cytobacillus sp. IB215316]MDX8361137.1 WecB/TagA/CpsF family glycosyltransferase [Cytobacillus sp. IB215316]
MKETILGIDVCTHSYDELIDELLNNIKENKKSFLVAINPEKVMKAQNDATLRKLLNSATYQIPDGIGVVLASKMRRGKIKSRVTGIDTMLKLCEAAANNKKRVFLYGAKPGVADQAKARLEEKYPGIQIVGSLHGYEKDEQVVFDTINHAKPDIIFVALGSPSQENWIIKHMDKLHPTVYQGVGGSYDVISGNLKRAPESFQRLGLEWLYRLIKEPWRFKRQLILPKFLIKAMKR